MFDQLFTGRRRQRLSCVALAAACALALLSPRAYAADKVRIVASFSILADLVRQVGGDHVAVTELAGPNIDMHGYQPTPADAKKILGAQLIVFNGLGLEGWTDRLVKASGFKGLTAIASKGVKPMAGDEHEHGRFDPHAWQDIANIKIYVANIRDALAKVDAAHKTDYEATAARYLNTLEALEAEVKSAYAPIPKTKRRVITSHDAFGYYGRAYGIEFLAPQGMSEDSEPSARDVAKLIRQIKKEHIKAVFVENISNPRLIERIAKETGVKLGGELYSDALSDAGGPAATYVDMMRHNTQAIAAALK